MASKNYTFGKAGASVSLPDDWTVQIDGDALQAWDSPPPKETCHLSLSLKPLPPIPLPKLPLKSLLIQSLGGRQDVHVSEIQRGKLQLVKTEVCFVDQQRNQPARTRTALAATRKCLALVSFNFWETDLERVHPVWVGVTESLKF